MICQLGECVVQHIRCWTSQMIAVSKICTCTICFHCSIQVRLILGVTQIVILIYSEGILDLVGLVMWGEFLGTYD